MAEHRELESHKVQLPDGVWESLGPRAKVIAQYWLEHPKQTLKEMGKELGVAPARVSQVINSNRFLKALRMETTRGLGRKGLAVAYKSYLECLDSKKSEEVKFRAASELLKSEKVLNSNTLEINHKFDGLTPDELKKIAQKSMEINSPIIDASIVEDELK